LKFKRMPGIYAITPETENTKQLLEKIEFLLNFNVKIYQYRNKSSNLALQKQQAAAISDLVKSKEGVFLVNDSVELAKFSNADGVHLGENDVSIPYARKKLSKSRFIGSSCYANLSMALKAYNSGADYVAFGSFFQSVTKPLAIKANLKLIGQFKKRATLPVVAIGGISENNVEEVLSSGADLVAISSALFNADNIGTSVSKINFVLEKFRK